MRVISQSLMEAGADFSQGVTLSGEKGRVNITPDESDDKLIISAEAGNAAESKRLAEGFERIIGELER